MAAAAGLCQLPDPLLMLVLCARATAPDGKQHACKHVLAARDLLHLRAVCRALAAGTVGGPPGRTAPVIEAARTLALAAEHRGVVAREAASGVISDGPDAADGSSGGAGEPGHRWLRRLAELEHPLAFASDPRRIDVSAEGGAVALVRSGMTSGTAVCRQVRRPTPCPAVLPGTSSPSAAAACSTGRRRRRRRRRRRSRYHHVYRVCTIMCTMAWQPLFAQPVLGFPSTASV